MAAKIGRIAGMSADQIDHRAIIASLSPSDRALLTGLTNRDGIVRAALHFGAIARSRRGDRRAGAAVAAIASRAGHSHRLPVHGHARDDPRHGLPDRRGSTGSSRRSRASSIFIPPIWFRYFHFAHHRHTHDPDNDPELMSPQARNGCAIRALPLGHSAVDRHGEGDRRQRDRQGRRALRARKGQGQGAAGSAHHARRLPGARGRLGRAVVAGAAVGVDRADRCSASRSCAPICWPSMRAARMSRTCWRTRAPPSPRRWCG